MYRKPLHDSFYDNNIYIEIMKRVRGDEDANKFTELITQELRMRENQYKQALAIKKESDDLRSLQIILLKDPKSGPVIEGTGGIRKVRFALENRGKSGSVRVCYTDFEEYEVTYLITAFTKSDQENLTNEEKNVLKKW